MRPPARGVLRPRKSCNIGACIERRSRPTRPSSLSLPFDSSSFPVVLPLPPLPPPPAALPAGSLNTLVAVGVFLVILSFAGCLGVRFNYKLGGRYLLGFYAFFMVLVMLMEFAAAISIFTFVGKLDEFGPAQQFKDQGIYFMINQSFTDCCCLAGYTTQGIPVFFRCPNGTCWLSPSLPFPCDSVQTFSDYLSGYIQDRIQPVAGVALFLCLLQLMTSITACCNQCAGRKTEEQKKIGGALAYDGLYNEGGEEAAYSGYGYESYVKSGAQGGAPRPGSAAAAAHGGGAAAPRVPAGPPRGPPVPPRAGGPGGPPAVPPRK